MKRSLWNTVASFSMLGFFVLLAVGSGTISPTPENTHLKRSVRKDPVKGEIHIDSIVGPEYTKVTMGRHDNRGRWNDSVVTVYVNKETGRGYIYEGRYYQGLRDGWFTITYIPCDGPCVVRRKDYYIMGRLTRTDNQITDKTESPTAFQFLKERYPWGLHDHVAMGTDSLKLEGFLNTVEDSLALYSLSDEEFGTYYDRVIEALAKEEQYAHIIEHNNFMSMIESADYVRSHEFRLAVVDRHLSGATNTYEVVESVYPGFLKVMNQAGVSDADFNVFCDSLDLLMDAGEPLDPDDPFYTDSIDYRLAMTLFSFLSAEKAFWEEILARQDLTGKSSGFRLSAMMPLLRERTTKAGQEMSPADISLIVFYGFILETYQGDAFRQAVRDAYFYNHMRLPVVATYFPGEDKVSDTDIAGLVIEDGNADITQRGIAWGTVYNPTTENNTVSSGSGIGEFSVTLTGLEEGKSYYARAYAVNSIGTAYGNVVAFTGKADPTGTANMTAPNLAFIVFPNPARDVLHIALELPGNDLGVVSLLGLDGRLVYSQVVEGAGRQEIKLQMHGLPHGVYIVRIDQGHHSATRKVIFR